MILTYITSTAKVMLLHLRALETEGWLPRLCDLRLGGSGVGWADASPDDHGNSSLASLRDLCWAKHDSRSEV